MTETSPPYVVGDTGDEAPDPSAPPPAILAIVARWQGAQVEAIPLVISYTWAEVPPAPATLWRPVPVAHRLAALRDGLPETHAVVVSKAVLDQALADLQTVLLFAAAQAAELTELRAELASERTRHQVEWVERAPLVIEDPYSDEGGAPNG